MNSVRHNTSKLKEYIAEARKNKLKLSSPSINQSNSSFELVNKEEIRFGLTAIKGIRRDFVEDILNERKQMARSSQWINSSYGSISVG